MADITWSVGVEKAEAQAAFLDLSRSLRVVQEQTDRVNASMGRMERVLGNQTKETFNFKRASGEALKEFTGWNLAALGTAAGVVAAVKAVANAYIDVQKEIKATKLAQADFALEGADKSRAFERNLMDFGGQGFQIQKDVLLAFHKRGVKTAVASSVGNELVQIADADGNKALSKAEKERLDADIGVASNMLNLGLAQDQVVGAFKLADRRDIPVDELLGMMEATRRAGDFEQENMLPLMQAAADKTPHMGDAMAMALAMRKGVSDPAAVAGMLSSTLGVLDNVGEGTKINKKYGLTGLDPLAKVEKLRAYALGASPGASEDEAIAAFVQQLDKSGVKGESQQGIALLLKNYSTIQEHRPELMKATQDGEDFGAQALKLRQPGRPSAVKIAQDTNEALLEWEAMFGPQGKKAQEELIRAQVKGTAARLEGTDRFDIRTGRYTPQRTESFVERLGQSTIGSLPGGDRLMNWLVGSGGVNASTAGADDVKALLQRGNELSERVVQQLESGATAKNKPRAMEKATSNAVDMAMDLTPFSSIAHALWKAVAALEAAGGGGAGGPSRNAGL